MKTTINVHIDAQLKSEAEKKARKQGTSLPAVLSEATRAFVDDELVVGIDRDIVENINRARVNFEEGAYD